MKLKIVSVFTILAMAIVTSSCYKEDELNIPIKNQPESEDELDQYIQENFVGTFGVAVRYKFVDRYVDQTKRVAPPRREVVRPMLDFLTSYWINPFIQVQNGKQFFEEHVPAEVILVGSPIFNEDGTVTLGTADAGARITLTEVNNIDLTDTDWTLRQLGTIYHEFAHIIHQRYDLPPNFRAISPQGYTSAGSWYNLTDEEALRRGFVSPYGTSSFNEDFAEMVAFMLYDPNFYTTYINNEEGCATADCAARNEGRDRLRQKYNSILSHYKQYTGVDLVKVRELIQAKL
jgi:substrate import-associated zinc metallohydrolase lipoprotein